MQFSDIFANLPIFSALLLSACVNQADRTLTVSPVPGSTAEFIIGEKPPEGVSYNFVRQIKCSNKYMNCIKLENLGILALPKKCSDLEKIGGLVPIGGFYRTRISPHQPMINGGFTYKLQPNILMQYEDGYGLRTIEVYDRAVFELVRDEINWNKSVTKIYTVDSVVASKFKCVS